MRKLLLFLTLAAALAFGAFIYRQAIVEGAFGPAAMFGSALLGLLALVLAAMTYLSGTRHRALVGNLLLAIFMTGFTYVVLDVGLGWLLIVPLSPPLVPDAYRHHALVPNSYAEIRQPDFDYIQRVNALGLRGRETTVQKPAGTRRILMLGDSFTMGKGVQDNETFPVIVETLLQPQLAACGGGALEVLNGGVDSYAPVLSALQLQRDLPADVAGSGGGKHRQQRPDPGGGLPPPGGSQRQGRDCGRSAGLAEFVVRAVPELDLASPVPDPRAAGLREPVYGSP